MNERSSIRVSDPQLVECLIPVTGERQHLVGKSRPVRQIGFSQAGTGMMPSEHFNSDFGLRDFSKSCVLGSRSVLALNCLAPATQH